MAAIPFRPQGFETLVLLILEQQVSIDSAKATFKITGMSKPLIDDRISNHWCHC
jgi:DNA-3-methyladenine glycosylase II